jgi:hypothetical protein
MPIYAADDASPVPAMLVRSATTITTESTSEVVLQGNAQASNIYWTAGSSITLVTNSRMTGTLIAGTSISLQTGARLDRRKQVGPASHFRNGTATKIPLAAADLRVIIPQAQFP